MGAVSYAAFSLRVQSYVPDRQTFFFVFFLILKLINFSFFFYLIISKLFFKNLNNNDIIIITIGPWKARIYGKGHCP